ncbi:MAG: hypothetical protein OEV49_14100 [candidate division Zixibacteria bacterium]|nr:hypothetical protein [candidate division Zixibacteria bacterium]MDH3938810.1 hypothetical protein [candidate division Zixibacteria bacterium]
MNLTRRVSSIAYAVAAVLVTVGIVLASAQPCSAFDRERNGFVLGFGAGPGFAKADYEDLDDLDEFGLQTNLVIGHGFSEKYMVYYTGLQFWGPIFFGRRDGLLQRGDIQLVLIPSAGIRYYLSQNSKSLFLGGGVGMSIMRNSNMGTFGLSGGAAFHGVAGYEFTQYVNVECIGLYSRASLLGSGEKESFWNLSLMLSFLAY